MHLYMHEAFLADLKETQHSISTHNRVGDGSGLAKHEAVAIID